MNLTPSPLQIDEGKAPMQRIAQGAIACFRR